jgi:hypothetical protein
LTGHSGPVTIDLVARSPRIPASLAVLMLHQEADRTGDDRLRISSATLRKWVERGHITRGDGDYDLGEIFAYLDRRPGRVSA